MQLKKLHIFTKEGNTFSFKNITNFTYNEYMITFDFQAQSDGEKKAGMFFVRNIAGFTQLS